MENVAIQIPPKSAYVGVVRLALASLARTAGLDEETVDDLCIAVSEACANSVLAHEERGSTEPVEVTWRVEPERIVLEVADRGATYEQADLAENTQTLRLTLSLSLLRSLVHDCEISARPGGGMVLRLVLDRRTPAAGEPERRV